MTDRRRGSDPEDAENRKPIVFRAHEDPFHAPHAQPVIADARARADEARRLREERRLAIEQEERERPGIALSARHGAQRSITARPDSMAVMERRPDVKDGRFHLPNFMAPEAVRGGLRRGWETREQEVDPGAAYTGDGTTGRGHDLSWPLAKPAQHSRRNSHSSQHASEHEEEERKEEKKPEKPRKGGNWSLWPTSSSNRPGGAAGGTAGSLGKGSGAASRYRRGEVGCSSDTDNE
ncbi:hypothetical protein JCM10450v2_002372 [Rhodotorula kratochvilovae]